MNVGTKSVLVGVHQFIWHPITVLLAWIDLYGCPKPWEVICILVHDIGYWGKPNMDGPEGHLHPETGAKLASWLCGERARLECLGHSRSYAKTHNIPTSRLCWADKWSPMFDPTHWYWLRGTLSGEIAEYRENFPRADGESSLMWAVAFKSFVKKNSHKIWAGSRNKPDHGFTPFEKGKPSPNSNVTHA